MLTDGRRAPHNLASQSWVSGSSSHTPSGLTRPHLSASRANSSSRRSSITGALMIRDLASNQWVVCAVRATTARLIAGAPPARRLKSPVEQGDAGGAQRMPARLLGERDLAHVPWPDQVVVADQPADLRGTGIEGDRDQSVENQQAEPLVGIFDDRRGIEWSPRNMQDASREQLAEFCPEGRAALP